MPLEHIPMTPIQHVQLIMQDPTASLIDVPALCPTRNESYAYNDPHQSYKEKVRAVMRMFETSDDENDDTYCSNAGSEGTEEGPSSSSSSSSADEESLHKSFAHVSGMRSCTKNGPYLRRLLANVEVIRGVEDEKWSHLLGPPCPPSPGEDEVSDSDTTAWDPDELVDTCSDSDIGQEPVWWVSETATSGSSWTRRGRDRLRSFTVFKKRADDDWRSYTYGLATTPSTTIDTVFSDGPHLDWNDCRATSLSESINPDDDWHHDSGYISPPSIPVEQPGFGHSLLQEHGCDEYTVLASDDEPEEEELGCLICERLGFLCKYCAKYGEDKVFLREYFLSQREIYKQGYC